MEIISEIKGLAANPSAIWPALEGKGQHVLDIVKNHPWATLGVATGTALLWSYARAPRNLPPGPTNYPFVGAVSLLSNDMVEKLTAWRSTYGEVIFYYMFGQPNVILNSERVIREAFVKKADNFSHREISMFFGYVGLADELFVAPYSEKWKKDKKFAISTLKNFGFGTVRAEGKICEQLENLEDVLIKSNGSPLKIIDEIKLLSAAVMYSIVLGENTSRDDPRTIELSRRVEEWNWGLSDCVGAMGIGGQLLSDFLNKLLYRKPLKRYKVIHEELTKFLMRAVEAHANGISQKQADSVIDAYLKERGTDPHTIKNVADAVLIFLPDAIDTNSIICNWSLFYLAYYPEIQRKLQKEIDAVCGENRRPTLADRAAMPYTQAVIHETLRYVNIIPLSLPRTLLEDTELEGYTLPKGSTVMGNFQGMHFDPELFPEPKKFNPSRFVGEDGKFISSLANKIMTFGLGPRKCIGEPFYKVQTFLFLTRLLQRFNLEFDSSAPKPGLEADRSYLFPQPQSFKLCCKPR